MSVRRLVSRSLEWVMRGVKFGKNFLRGLQNIVPPPAGRLVGGGLLRQNDASDPSSKQHAKVRIANRVPRRMQAKRIPERTHAKHVPRTLTANRVPRWGAGRKKIILEKMIFSLDTRLFALYSTCVRSVIFGK